MKAYLIKYAAVLPVLAVMSCTGQEEKPAVPEIVAGTNLEIPAAGGEMQFDVSVANQDGTSVLSASCDAAWVTLLKVSEDNASVSFTALANESEEERGAEIVLSYPGAEDVSVSLVQQASAPVVDESVRFTFEVLYAGPSTARISIEPDDQQAGYLAYVTETSKYEQVKDEAEFIRLVLDYYGSMGDLALYVRKGTGEMEAARLTPGTGYTVAAFGYDVETSQAGTVGTCTFTTEDAPAPEDISFTIQITEVAGTSVTARFTPEPKYYPYAVFAVKASDAASYGSDLGAWDSFMKAIVDQFIESGAISSYRDYYEHSCARDEFYVKIEKLEQGTEYYAGALLVDENMDVLALPSLSEKFSTPAKPEEDPVISLASVEYFDGTAVAEKYPEYSKFSGKALVPVTIDVENSSYWFVGAMDKSYYDMYLPANYLEIALVQMSICVEKISSDNYPGETSMTHFFAIGWNRDIMVIGLAYSDESKAAKSEFATVHVKPEQGGAADIAEFEKYL